MAQQQQEKQHENQAHQDGQRLKAEVGKHVMQTLGQPSDLFRVQVRQLWDDRYRVNVLVGADVLCAKVAHSYFLVVDGDGKVVTSSPRIKKHY